MSVVKAGTHPPFEITCRKSYTKIALSFPDGADNNLFPFNQNFLLFLTVNCHLSLRPSLPTASS